MALDIATGDIIIFIDDDVILSSDFIYSHMKHHQILNNVVLGNVRDVFISNVERTFSKLLNYPLKKDCFIENLRRIDSKSRENLYFSLARIPFSFEYNNIPWIGFGTNNSSVAKYKILESGNFSEKYIGWGLDNIESGLKLYKNGLNFIYEPAAENFHLAHSRSKETHLKEFKENLAIFLNRNNNLEADLFWEYIQEEISIEEFNYNVVNNKIPDDIKTFHYYKGYQDLLRWLEQTKNET